jgi:hypothetical protein
MPEHDENFWRSLPTWELICELMGERHIPEIKAVLRERIQALGALDLIGLVYIEAVHSGTPQFTSTVKSTSAPSLKGASCPRSKQVRRGPDAAAQFNKSLARNNKTAPRAARYLVVTGRPRCVVWFVWFVWLGSPELRARYF